MSQFPLYEGKPLSWSIGLYFTLAEREIGYPRLKTVANAMREQRPDQYAAEVQNLRRARYDRMFGHNAEELLIVLGCK